MALSELDKKRFEKQYESNIDWAMFLVGLFAVCHVCGQHVDKLLFCCCFQDDFLMAVKGGMSHFVDHSNSKPKGQWCLVLMSHTRSGCISPHPDVSAEQRGLMGGGHFALLPLRPRELRNVATSGKRRWMAYGLNFLKDTFFFLKIEVTGQVKLRSKVKYYSF